jgi:hypothetical protein
VARAPYRIILYFETQVQQASREAGSCKCAAEMSLEISRMALRGHRAKSASGATL